jgi:hypothetical protein
MMWVFWVVTPCGLVGSYQRFGRTCRPHPQRNGGDTFLRKLVTAYKTHGVTISISLRIVQNLWRVSLTELQFLLRKACEDNTENRMLQITWTTSFRMIITNFQDIIFTSLPRSIKCPSNLQAFPKTVKTLEITMFLVPLVTICVWILVSETSKTRGPSLLNADQS